MGVFEKVLQERQPAAETVALTPRQAFAAIIIGAFNADGRVAPEEAARVNDIFSSTKLFRQPSPAPGRAELDQIAELFRKHGTDPVLALAASVLPRELCAPAFATAVDLVLADGEASVEERSFIDALQNRLKISDEEAARIVDVMLIKNSA